MSSFVNDLMRKLFLLGDDNTGYLVFVRHGESRRQSDSSDVKGFDTPLSSRGRRQARAVADRLKHRTIDALYSSPLKRARETAEVTAEETDLELTVKDGLREVDIDREKALSVMGDEDPYERYDSWSSTLEDFRWGSFEFAESSESLRDRVRSTLSSIVDNHPGETVVVFSHTGVINAYLADCLGLESDLLTLPAHTGLSTVRTLGNKRAVVTINDYSHLR